MAALTGAGVSAESGVATFRDAQTGLWSKFDPEQLASQAGFAADPGLVWRWYMARLATVESAVCNPGHLALTRLEQMVPQFTLVTQNVDNLHERAGSQNVLHLHGEISRCRCNVCRRPYALRAMDRTADEPPRCPQCGGLVRPDVVWFGEGLPAHVMDAAWRAAEDCEVCLVVGTSGVVYPAAQLPVVAKQMGAVVIEVNPETTFITAMATVAIAGPSGQVLPRLVQAVEEARR